MITDQCNPDVSCGFLLVPPVDALREINTGVFGGYSPVQRHF